MRYLVLASCLAALLALAQPASISQTDNFEKKLQEAVKEVLDKDAKIPSEQELEQSNTIKDIDNQLLKQAGVEAIPVKVVVEDVQPVLKTDKEKEECEKAEDDAADIERVEIDLKHPGEPQHQEHETQNPEHFEDEEGTLASIKQMIKNTQVVFNDGFKDVSERIEDWLRDNKPEISIKNSIENLQETFMDNINKLNSTIQGYWNQAAAEKPEKQVEIQKVQSGLKVLEEKFESGVETLNNGVRNLAVLKTETRDDASSTTAKPSGFQIPFVSNFWNTMTQNFGNITNQFQNIIGQAGNSSEPSGTQSDETSASTSRPTVWQGIQNQIQGIFQGKPGQQGAQNDEQPGSQPGGPFAQVVQNVPLLQNFVNFIQPKPQQQTAQTQSSSEPAQSTNSGGSNVVPAEPAKPTDQQQKNPDQDAQPAEQQPQRPIQQIIQKNPVVQGIAGAIQKIQHSITNPEKPREEVEQKEGDEKAGFYPWHGGHGHRPGDGDNNDVSVSGVVKSVPAEAEKPVAEAQKPMAEAESPAPADPAARAPEAEKPAPAASPEAA